MDSTDAITYSKNYAIMRELWTNWQATDAAAALFAERCADLNQRILNDCIKRHRCEAAGQYNEPKIHRILEMYGETMRGNSVQQHFTAKVNDSDLSPEEIAEQDMDAEEVIAGATADEIKRACAGYPIEAKTAVGKRLLAAAIRRMRRQP
jgi:hypothetical protein